MATKKPFRGKANVAHKSRGTPQRKPSPSQGMSSNKSDSRPKCFYCGRVGHIAKHCRKKKFDEGQQRHKKHAGHFADEEHNLNLRLFVSDSTFSAEDDEAETWFVDSGASTHMIGKKHWFENFKETSSGGNIYLGDDRGYQIKGYGNVPIVFPDGNIRHIQNVNLE